MGYRGYCNKLLTDHVACVAFSVISAKGSHVVYLSRYMAHFTTDPRVAEASINWAVEMAAMRVAMAEDKLSPRCLSARSTRSFSPRESARSDRSRSTAWSSSSKTQSMSPSKRSQKKRTKTPLPNTRFLPRISAQASLLTIAHDLHYHHSP